MDAVGCNVIHVMICVTLVLVIKTFRDRDTERLFASGVSRRF